MKCTSLTHRIEIHATGDAPNCKPVLKISCNGTEQVIAEVELYDFCGVAQALYESELMYNLGIQRGSRQFNSKVKQLRKALGYSYP